MLCTIFRRPTRKVKRSYIKKAKRKCWKTLCRKVNDDIRGDGYKIVIKGLMGYPPKVNLTMETMDKSVKHVFPNHPDVIFVSAVTK